MPSQRPTRVVLADDHSMVREALARILEDSGAATIVGQASDGADVLKTIEETDPECVVLDYSMPNHDAPALIANLQQTHPRLKILVLTVHENIHYAVRVLESGAHGYLIKSAAVDELVQAIRTVHDGGIYLSPSVSQEVLVHLRNPKRNRLGLESLSQREFDLLRMLGEGKTLQQCAKQMKVSTSTASTYRSRLMEKMNLNSTAEIIRFALEHNVIE